MTDIPVKVPKELLGVSATVLEDYVRSRLLQFIKRFGVSLGQLLPGFTPALLDRAVHDTVRALPHPDYGQVPLERRQLQLVFRHDCQALGCLEPQCPLCQHNSKRRCTVNFCKKYLVNDRMLARCGAQIRIEVINRATGRLCDSDLSDVFLEVFVLNGTSYDQRFLDATRTSTLPRADSTNPDGIAALNKDLDECALLTNNKGKPLLTSLAGGKTAEDGKTLIIQTVRGRVVLPDLTVTDSSEALLSGRKPPFRLVVRAKRKGGQHLSLRPAVSEAFVVATRRVRTSHKADIPTMDDPVAKLMHMGKETCRKLADLYTAAEQANVELDLDQSLACIEKVGEFKALALRAEADGQLRQLLQTLLKLPKEKWDECVQHAKLAVFPDNRTRAWHADRTQSVGLLFPADLGVVDLKRPEALLQRVLDPTGVSRLQVIQQQQQTPAQRDVVRQLLPQAEECWWSPGHPGWTLFDPDAPSAEASPSPVLAGLSQLAATPLPVAAGKGLIVATPGPAAAPGMGLEVLTPQLQGYAAANRTGLTSPPPPAATTPTRPPAAAAAAVLPAQPEQAIGLSLQQQQQQQQMMAAAAAGVQLPPPSPLNVVFSNASFPQNPARMDRSPAAHRQHTQPTGQQQQQPSAAAHQTELSAATTPVRRRLAQQSQVEPVVTSTPQTPARPSAFAALAAQPITAGDSPMEQSPAAAAAAAAGGGGGGAGEADALAATTAAAAARALAAADTSGLSSSGLDSSLQPRRKSSSGMGSWLPPLSGRKRSFAAASGGSGGQGPDTTAAGEGRSTQQHQGPGGAPAAAVPGHQLSADMERLLSAAGFTPGLPGSTRDAPSLTASLSLGLFMDTVNPAAAAGGGTGAALLRPTAGAAPSRAASAGLSRLLSLDLASLLRGTSLFPTSAALPPILPGSGGGGVVEDDGLPTPHAAAAAEGLMALSAPLGGLGEPQGGEAGTGLAGVPAASAASSGGAPH